MRASACFFNFSLPIIRIGKFSTLRTGARFHDSRDLAIAEREIARAAYRRTMTGKKKTASAVFFLDRLPVSRQ
jgi:hypothetical protein